MRIYIVDNSKRFREAIKAYLRYVLDCKVVGEADDGLEFLKNYRYNNDIVLMDLHMPVINGATAIERVLQKDSRVKAIAMTMEMGSFEIKELIEIGFKGLIFKRNISSLLKISIEAVLNGNKFFYNDNQLDLKG